MEYTDYQLIKATETMTDDEVISAMRVADKSLRERILRNLVPEWVDYYNNGLKIIEFDLTSSKNNLKKLNENLIKAVELSKNRGNPVNDFIEFINNSIPSKEDEEEMEDISMEEIEKELFD